MTGFRLRVAELAQVLSDSPAADKVVEKGAQVSAGAAMTAGGLTYYGLTPAEWGLVFAAGSFLATIVFGAIHVWIRLQHLKLDRESRS